MVRDVLIVLLGLLSLATPCSADPLWPGFSRAEEFGEQVRWLRMDSGIRVFVSASAEPRGKDRLLVIYATPNGSTIEQTLGCAKRAGLDWHYDIQHVAAQIRLLRSLNEEQDIVLAVVQAPKLSWPAFRKAEHNADQIITDVVVRTAEEVGAKRIALAGHSGGGSFLLGCLDAADAIPDHVERIVFLDANYSYSDEKRHGDKLLAWLQARAQRRLVVLAYDDREVMLNGKKVVGPDGGTYRATERMTNRFQRSATLHQQRVGNFVHTSALGGQIQLFVHLNPENKILHTALVGEMNGLTCGLTLGTKLEGHVGSPAGPRAYSQWISKQPIAETPDNKPPQESNRIALRITHRPDDALSGSAFRDKITALTPPEREAAVLKELLAGNVPEFLRRLKPIELESISDDGTKHSGSCFVTPDCLSVGADGDFLRLPMTPMTAIAIAHAWDGSLITAQLSDRIFAQAEVKLKPLPLTRDRESVATFYEHHRLIEGQRGGKELGLLVAGIKKDVVLTNRLKEKPHRVALYGWHQAEGKPIQPLYVGHVDHYVDYSHGIRLMSRRMIVDGSERDVMEIVSDPVLCRLLTSEGPLDSNLAESLLKPGALPASEK